MPLPGLAQLKYPVTKKVDVVDGYAGTFKVPTPIAGWKMITVKKPGPGLKKKIK